MVIKGTVEKVGNNKLIVSKKPYSYVLVTFYEEQLPQLCVGTRVKIKGEWYEKHYLKRDFTIGTVMAVSASSIQTL